MRKGNKWSNFKDETGNRYGMLTVKGFVGSWRGKGAAWLCVCDCGNETIVTGVNLRRGYTRSCGCINKLTNEERRRVVSELQGTDTKADREG